MDIRKIPGNEPVIEELVDGLRRSRLVCMAGAGVSAPIFPVWNGLVTELIKWSEIFDTNQEMRATWRREALARPEYVCGRIKSIVGTKIFNEKIEKIFCDPVESDAPLYTETHRIISEIPFKAVLTTNFDRGLLNARRANDLVDNSGFMTWKDDHALLSIQGGELDSLGKCPLFHCHGIVGNHESIVLTDSDYRAAYSNRLYKRVFEQFWCAYRLVFIGFGHADRWLELVRTLALADIQLPSSKLELRHISFIPIRDLSQSSNEMRNLYESQFGTKLIFYDSVNNHSNLVRFLDELPKWPSPDKVNPCNPYFELGKDWVHETTNDEFYVGRLNEKRSLNAFVADDSTRLISITGLGGQGKTSLVGSWLKDNEDQIARPFKGLLYWSFYNNLSCDDFFKRILAITGHNAYRSHQGVEGRSSRRSGSTHQKTNCDLAMEALENNSLLLILDGLEVLQESMDTNFGAFLNNDLRHFLVSAATRTHNSLVVLTSRFLFRDLIEFDGKSLRSLPLLPLSIHESRDLLRNLGLTHSRDDVLDSISLLFEGHPLALRFFSATLDAMAHDDPTVLVQRIKTHTAIGDKTLELKIQKLVEFYVNECPILNKEILTAIAVFRIPVPTEAVFDLVIQYQSEVEIEDCAVSLESLKAQGLVIIDNIDGDRLVSCHPVVRDSFRTLMPSDSEFAPLAADFLSSQPGINTVTSMDQLQPLAAAIEVLADGDKMDLADSLYKDRLIDGRVFYEIPAIHVGQHVTNSFISTEARRDQTKRVLGRDRMIRLVTSTAEYSAHIGDIEEANRLFNISLSHSKGTRATQRNRSALRLQLRMNLIAGLEINTTYQTLRGLAIRTDQPMFQPSLFLLAGLAAALSCDPEASKFIFNSKHRDAYRFREEIEHIALWDVIEAEIYYLFGDIESTKRLAKRALSAADGVKAKALRIHPLIQLSLAGSPSLNAKKPIKYATEAVELCESSHLFLTLPTALNALAMSLASSNKLSDAMRAITESIQLSRSRKLQRPYLDSLAIKAHIISLDSSFGKAELMHALDICVECEKVADSLGYTWGKLRANQVIASVHDKLGNSLEADKARLFFTHSTEQINTIFSALHD